MTFRKKPFQATITYLLLVVFGWMIGGGPTWAEERAARNDPRAFLLRVAEDPRLSLTDEQRTALRAAARREDAGDLLARMADDPRLVLSEEQRERLRHWSRDSCCAPASSPAREMTKLAFELRTASKEATRRGDVRAAAAHALDRFAAADAMALADFDSTERALRHGDVPAEVLARHDAVVADYRRQAAAVRRDLEAARNGDDVALASAATALAGSYEERPHRPYDPARLPFSLVEPIWREPGRAPETPREKSAEPPVRAAADVAPLAPPTSLSHAVPRPDDLAETIDVQITPEIRDLALSLGDEPLRIYDWVRNNVEFYPTWGSVQGSQRTLDMRRGNAFDVASLLIALLRSAGVGARYVMGTVEIPLAEAQNWVGGAATPKVTQQILGQGGIANVGLVGESGAVEAIRLEHVWVEAWIDYVPSRGAVHREGDSWLPLDASFKQHVFTPASDLFAAVPFDTVFDPADPPFVVDESLGKVTEISTDALDARMEQWVQDVDDYILAHDVEQTFTGILGGKEIVPVTHAVFAGALPYGVVERRSAIAALPASLRHEVRLRGFRTALDRAMGSAVFDLLVSLPELDARRLGLRFPPATQVDADVLEAARNNGASSLPVYLVDLVPVVELDGVELARGGALGMGSAFFVDIVLEEPGHSETIPYEVVAGDEIVIGITGNGVDEKVVEKRFAAFPIDNAPEYLHQVQLHYWAEIDYLGAVAAARRGVHFLRLPSVGLFSSTLSVSTLFGSPRSAVYAGRVMDVQRSLVGAAGIDKEQVVSWAKQSGTQGSYLEGSVFEQLELAATGTPHPNGISSVHLLMAAIAQGVPIYRITPANAAAVQPLLRLPAAIETDVANALATGQTVFVPETTIDLGSWEGAGYIFQDEETGAGAYLISGGFAGGGILDCLRELEPIFKLILALVLVALLLAVIALLILSTPVVVVAGSTTAAALLFLIITWRGSAPTTAPPGA